MSKSWEQIIGSRAQDRAQDRARGVDDKVHDVGLAMRVITGLQCTHLRGIRGG